MRKVKFAKDHYYHVYNRGVDKRTVFQSKQDYERFLESLVYFNSTITAGGLREQKYQNPRNRVSGVLDEKIVDVVAYCLNPNHFHLILCQKKEGGISDFMKRVSGGYTKYFNDKHRRSGSLFQGPFKAIHIDSDAYLMHLAVYVTLNNYVHDYSEKERAMTRSSLAEYFVPVDEPICSNFELITRGSTSPEEFWQRHKTTLAEIQQRKAEDQDWQKMCLD